jgi:hypothetical protein
MIKVTLASGGSNATVSEAAAAAAAAVAFTDRRVSMRIISVLCARDYAIGMRNRPWT